MKIIICILIILITLVTNAFGKVLTKEEIANFMLNAYGKWNTVTQTEIDNVNNLMAHWQTIADNTSSHEGYYSMGYSNRLKQFFFVYYTGGNTQLNTEGNTAWMYSTSGGRNYIGKYSYTGNGSLTYNITKYNISTNSYNEISQTNGSDNGNTEFGISSGSTLWLYTDKKLGASTGGGLAAQGQVPNGENLFAENYISSIQWQVTPAINNTMHIPNNENTFYQIPYSSFTNYLGSLTDANYLGNIITEIYAYNGTNWEKVNQLNIYDNQNEDLDVFGPLITDNNGIKTLLLRLNSRYITPNTYIVYYIEPTQEANEQYNLQGLREFFYITNNKTILSGDTLNIIATFSGDTNYVDNVNNAIDNEQQNQNNINLDETNKGIQDINNTLEEAKEQNQNFFTYIRDFCENLFTVSGEQIEQLKEQIKDQLEQMGTDIEPYLEEFEQIISTAPGDFIIAWDDIKIHLTTNNGETIVNQTLISGDRINFSQMARQNPTLYTIKTWANVIASFSIICIIQIEYIATIERILGLNPQELKDITQDDDEQIVVQGFTYQGDNRFKK